MILKLSENEKLVDVEYKSKIMRNKTNTYGNYTKKKCNLPTLLVESVFTDEFEKGTRVYIISEDGKLRLSFKSTDNSNAYSFSVQNSSNKTRKLYTISFNKNIYKLVPDFDNKDYIKFIIGVEGLYIAFE